MEGKWPVSACAQHRTPHAISFESSLGSLSSFFPLFFSFLVSLLLILISIHLTVEQSTRRAPLPPSQECTKCRIRRHAHSLTLGRARAPMPHSLLALAASLLCPELPPRPHHPNSLSRYLEAAVSETGIGSKGRPANCTS